jgi:uncharacterized membrane protein YagU involved in acid resistance
VCESDSERMKELEKENELLYKMEMKAKFHLDFDRVFKEAVDEYFDENVWSVEMDNCLRYIKNYIIKNI